MKLLSIFFIVFFYSIHICAQSTYRIKIKGHVYDSENRIGLSDATVSLLHTSDSSRATIAFTDKSGGFITDSIYPGDYFLYVTYLGYSPVMNTIKIVANNSVIELGSIFMHRGGFTLSEIEVIERKSPVKVKRDTLEFNAGYFKTKYNALVEDLLKKIPGIIIESDGTIKVNGEIVKTIMVNGRPLFDGSDPKVITRSIQADLIDKIQVIDRHADQRLRRGFDDGQPDKIINITVKKDKQNLISGELTASYGTSDRYATKVSMNRFREHQQLVLVGGGDNINGAIEGGFIGGAGLQRNWNVGFNYSDDISNKLAISASLLMSNDYKNDQRNSTRENILNDSSSFYKQQYGMEDRVSDASINIQVEYKMDSLQKLVFTNRVGVSIASSNLESFYSSLRENLEMINYGDMHNSNERHSNTISNNLYYERKFSKLGRTLSISASYAIGRRTENGFNISNNTYVINSAELIDSINQNGSINAKSRQRFITLDFIEPVFKKSSVVFSFAADHIDKPSSRSVYDYNPRTKDYDFLNDSLSTNFESVNIQNYGKITWRTFEKKWNYDVSLGLLNGKVTNSDYNTSDIIRLRTTVLLPEGNFNYFFNKNGQLRFSYHEGIQFPDLRQIQPLVDNSNPLYIKQGNPDLKPEHSRDISFIYNSFDANSLRNLSVNLSTRFIQNKIVDGISFDSLGKQVSQPVNLDGAYFFRLNIDNGFPIKKRESAFSFNTNAVLNRNLSYTNGERGANVSLSVAQSISFIYTYKKLFDFVTAVNGNYGNVRYSNSGFTSSKYFTYGLSFAGNVTLPFGIIFSSNLNYSLSTGRADGFNTKSIALNASFSKLLFSHKQGLIKLQGFDLLGQNVSISRNIGESYIEDLQSKVLQRFFLLRFSYFLGK